MQKKLLVISVCLLQPNFLPPANEVWGKVIFSEACVKNSVHGEGGWPGPRGGGWVPGGDPPQTVTAADGTHPTRMHSC